MLGFRRFLCSLSPSYFAEYIKFIILLEAGSVKDAPVEKAIIFWQF